MELNHSEYLAALERLSKLAVDLIEAVAVEKAPMRAVGGHSVGTDLIAETVRSIETAMNDIEKAYDADLAFWPKKLTR